MNYSGFLRRFFAFIIDACIVFLPGLALGVALPYVGAMVVSFLYYVIFEVSVIQATPGKYLMGIRVLSEDGSKLNLTSASIRYFMKIVSGLLMGIGYLVQIFTAKRQALHDIVAGAVVVDHQWSQAPDWAGAWLQQIKLILKSAEMSAPFKNVSTPPEQELTSDEAGKKIIKLQDLLKQGLISEQEFLDKKSEVLTEMLKR